MKPEVVDSIIGLFSIIILIIGAVLGAKGGLLARSSKPDLVDNFRTLFNTVRTAYESSAATMARLHNTLEDNSNQSPEKLYSLVRELTLRIGESERAAYESLRHGADNTRNEELQASRARACIQLSTLIAVVSAILQMVVLYRVILRG